MSEREGERERERTERSNCSGRGSGLAAAAISVAVGAGVGAALYYFLNKRTENPDAGESTQNWREAERNFRERSWSLEECSICFDVILKDQEVMSLPCSHNFHSGCIMPWLEQQQNCPNCRKSID